MTDSLTCPKCGADYPMDTGIFDYLSECLRPGATTVCLSCHVFLRVDDGVLVRFTAEEMEVFWKSFMKVPSGKIDYEDPNVP